MVSSKSYGRQKIAQRKYTKYSGKYWFFPGDRIYESILKIIHIMDAFYIAVEFTVAPDPVFKADLSDARTLETESFDVFVLVPVKTPMQYLVRNEPARFVQIDIGSKNRLGPMTEFRKIVHAGMILTGLITPIFVDFFEQHRPMLVTEFGGDTKAWPPIANFARIIRNFIVHHQGRAHFDNPNAPSVSWHHLTYGPKDDGMLVVGYGGGLGGAIGLGELVLLLMEFTGELDGWGCPPLTMTEPSIENLAKVHRQGPDNPEYRDLVTKFGPLPRRDL